MFRVLVALSAFLFECVPVILDDLVDLAFLSLVQQNHSVFIDRFHAAFLQKILYVPSIFGGQHHHIEPIYDLLVLQHAHCFLIKQFLESNDSIKHVKLIGRICLLTLNFDEKH